MPEESDAEFGKLTEAFADALDEWSRKVTEILEQKNLPQKSLVARLAPLRSVDASQVSRWLSGHEQLWKGRAALPGAGLTRDIIQALQLSGHDADLLTQRATRVDQLQKQLMEHKGWRKKACEHLQSAANAADRTDSTEGAKPAFSNRRFKPWEEQPTWARAALAGVLLAAVTAAFVIMRPGGVQDTANGSDSTSSMPSDSMSSAAPGGPTQAVPTEAPGLEKGTLGEDSRCSESIAGPEAITWRVCTRVEATRVSFALKVTNHGSNPTTVKIRLQYVQAGKFHTCPKAPDTHPLRVTPGEPIITDLEECTVLRQTAPFAYQGVGWLLAKDANAGSYKLSPTAHVRPEGVVWRPDLVSTD
ncbi:hypothetical protein [Streptomyces sp. NPDC050388]|uniref:hypothetical protein n=1 Tax=Streptomyces sp. NPDC050388 TaxID=3155781 RepID=UPI00342B98BD